MRLNHRYITANEGGRSTWLRESRARSWSGGVFCSGVGSLAIPDRTFAFRRLVRELRPTVLTVMPVPPATTESRKQRLDALQRFVVFSVAEQILAELKN